MSDSVDDETIRVRRDRPDDRTQRSSRRPGIDAEGAGGARSASAQIDTAPIDVDPTATMPASRVPGAAEDTIVAREPAAPRAADSPPDAPTGRRSAQRGEVPQRIYRPRVDEPVVVARTPPPPRTAQAAVDTAAVHAQQRRIAVRRAAWLTIGAVTIALAGIATVILLTVGG